MAITNIDARKSVNTFEHRVYMSTLLNMNSTIYKDTCLKCENYRHSLYLEPLNESKSVKSWHVSSGSKI